MSEPENGSNSPGWPIWLPKWELKVVYLIGWFLKMFFFFTQFWDDNHQPVMQIVYFLGEDEKSPSAARYDLPGRACMLPCEEPWLWGRQRSPKVVSVMTIFRKNHSKQKHMFFFGWLKYFVGWSAFAIFEWLNVCKARWGCCGWLMAVDMRTSNSCFFRSNSYMDTEHHHH